MWSRIKRMSCIPSKAPNHQALKGDRSEAATTDIDLPSRCRQVVIPDLSGVERAVSMRLLEKEAARTEEVLLKISSANSSPETSSTETHAPIVPKGLKLDTSGPLPVKNPDTFSCTNIRVDRLPQIFEDATTLASDRAPMKLTGTGAPGSHSALFGLTPDGHREDEADYSAPKLPLAVKIAGNASAPNVDGPEDAKMKISNYQHTVSHSALFGLVPVAVARPKGSEVKQAPSKTELVQEVPSESGERAADAVGTPRRPQTVSHSALFGLMPEGFGENQANKWLSNAEPARRAEARVVFSGGLGNAGPVALSSGCVGWGCHDGHER